MRWPENSLWITTIFEESSLSSLNLCSINQQTANGQLSAADRMLAGLFPFLQNPILTHHNPTSCLHGLIISFSTLLVRTVWIPSLSNEWEKKQSFKLWVTYFYKSLIKSVLFTVISNWCFPKAGKNLKGLLLAILFPKDLTSIYPYTSMLKKTGFLASTF